MTTVQPDAFDAPRAALGDDLEHLRLLAIFHYVVAGVAALVSLLPGVGVVLGLAMASGRVEPQDEGARVVGWLMAGCAAFFMTIGFAFAALVASTGRALARRRWYTFCLVVATALCIVVPLGTLLGVFTIIVLVRPSVRALFEAGGATGAIAVRA